MIFYFTATGNSKYIAEKIAIETGDRLISVADCVQMGSFAFDLADGESVGFVVPVYWFGIPMIVMEFLHKLCISPRPDYAYAVLNCGATTANAASQIRRLFPLDAEFGIAMVDNYPALYKLASAEAANQQLDRAEPAIAAVCGHIKKRSRGDFNDCKGPLPRFVSQALYPVYKHGRKTRKFNVNEDCTGCGLCEKICPRRAIALESGSPVWTAPRCETCFACLHRCPAQAIDYGRSAVNGRYLNPRVTNFSD
jgi:NAD-dependent dihydropyrimidine dehydrogenase PreA subunit